MSRPVTVTATASPAEAARVLSKALVRSASLLGLDGAALARIIGVSESSVSRLAHGSRVVEPGSKEAELAALVIRCFRSLDALVGGNDGQRRAWMSTYNHALNGIPRELMGSAQGLVTTLSYLDRMRAPL